MKNKEHRSKLFLEKIKTIHPEYDYSKMNYINSDTKILIGCNNGHWFNQTPYNNLKHGYPKCKFEKNYKNRMISKDEFLKRSMEKHRVKFDYSLSNYVDYNTKMEIICDKGHHFYQRPSSHAKGFGCPKCSNRDTLTNDEFLNRCKLINPNYDYSKTKYIKSNNKVKIICDKGHEFNQTPNSHLSGCKCPFCLNRGLMNHDLFIKKAKEKYPKYNYKNVIYKTRLKKVEITCDKGHLFMISPSSFLNYTYGCPRCAKKSTLGKIDQNDFINECKLLHPDYDYSKSIYNGMDNKVLITCNKKHDFWQTPYHHIKRKHICPKCSNMKRHDDKVMSQEDFIFRCSMIFPNYDYSLVNYISSVKKVELICSCGNKFKQKANSVMIGKIGCKFCVIKSKGENKIKQYFENINIKYISQYRIDAINYNYNNNIFIFDFFISDFKGKKYAIEYNGEQHYKHVPVFHRSGKTLEKQQQRDADLRNYCNRNDITLIEIPYWDYDNIETILNNIFL